jgi:flagellar motor protein MotB
MFEKKRRQNTHGDTAQTGWQTIYCSLMLILVVLFLMLISISSADHGSLKRLQGALGEREDRAKDKASYIGTGGTGVPAGKGTPAMDPTIISAAVEALRKTAATAGLERKVIITGTRSGFKVTMDASALFPSGTAIIGEKPRPFLDEMNRIAYRVPFFIRVDGHGQDRVEKGNTRQQWDLPAKRAMAIIRFFHEEGRIAGSRLLAAGFGQTGSAEKNQDRNPGGRIAISFNGEEG